MGLILGENRGGPDGGEGVESAGRLSEPRTIISLPHPLKNHWRERKIRSPTLRRCKPDICWSFHARRSPVVIAPKLFSCITLVFAVVFRLIIITVLIATLLLSRGNSPLRRGGRRSGSWRREMPANPGVTHARWRFVEEKLQLARSSPLRGIIRGLRWSSLIFLRLQQSERWRKRRKKRWRREGEDMDIQEEEEWGREGEDMDIQEEEEWGREGEEMDIKRRKRWRRRRRRRLGEMEI